MVFETQESLEQIAEEIQWPDEISQYMETLRNNLDDDVILDALTISISEDSKELQERYFRDYPDKNITQLIAYARQNNWSSEKKVQLGAIEGVDYMWFMVERGLRAVAWGSNLLNAVPAQVVRRAIEMLPGTELNIENMKNIETIPLINYQRFIYLLANCEYIITDGGSIQEESLIFKKPCIILRKRTERQEGLNTGINFLTGLNISYSKNIIENIEKGKINVKNFKNPYGKLGISKKILDILK